MYIWCLCMRWAWEEGVGLGKWYFLPLSSWERGREQLGGQLAKLNPAQIVIDRQKVPHHQEIIPSVDSLLVVPF